MEPKIIFEYGVVSGLKIEKEIIEKSKEVCCFYGFGKKSLLAAEEAAKRKIKCMICVGFAASTNKMIKSTEICLPKNIVWCDGTINKTSEKYRRILKEKLKKYTISEKNLFCSEKIIYKKSEKKDIYDLYDAHLIDMESESVQKISKKKNIPFVALKISLDDSETSLPEDFIKIYMKEKSKIYLFKCIFYLPTIFKLAIDYQRSKKKLDQVCRHLFNSS